MIGFIGRLCLITVDYNSSHIELLLDKESLAALWISDWSLVSRILDLYTKSSRVLCYEWHSVGRSVLE
jgi:hypothetical protein